MKRENNKIVDKSEEIALLKGLVELLPDIELNMGKTGVSTPSIIFQNLPNKNDKDLRALLILSGPLYFILGVGNKIVHRNGYSYRILSKKNLISHLTIAAETASDIETVISRYLDSYLTSNAGLDDLWVYDLILNKLRELGFDLEYTPEPNTESTTEKINLQRVNRLIESLKNFLAGDALKDKFLNEYILLNILNLPRIQKEVQDQILFKMLDDLAPSKLLVAYYKVYQKLPIGYA